MSPSSTAVSAFTGLALISILTGNIPVVFVWLALARNVEIIRNTARDRSANRVLGMVDSPHGNCGKKIYKRNGNTVRDRKRVLEQLQGHGPKAFLRRFKMSRPMFDDVVEKIKPIVEPGEYGITRARRSSGSHVPAELQLAASLRWLSGASYLCQEDNFGLGGTTFFKCLWNCVYALDNVLPSPEFDITDEGKMKAHADGMYVRSGRTTPGCIGALDGMAVRITRPTLKDTASPQMYMNRKGFYSLNLQAISDCNRKFLWWNIGSVGSTHDSLAWTCTPLARQLATIGLPYGLWIAGDDAYPSSDYLISPYSAQACRLDKHKDNFNFYQSRCRINVECAFGILVEKYGVLRRSMSSTMAHSTMVVNVCIKLHNLGVDNGHYRIAALDRDFRIHDDLMPIQQHVVSKKPKYLKNKVDSTLRDGICDVLKAQGHTRPIANRKRMRNVNCSP